ncbi:ferredoxin [Streptomyces sp. NPDC049813]|uniref:ferredoxin n=1 Tax=Streptomyces sp. NPDC049813 TaxID=3365597 RepID=UPI0037A17D2C
MPLDAPSSENRVGERFSVESNVEVDTEVCVGAGQCVLAAPGVFDQRDEDGIVTLLSPAPSREAGDAVREAVQLCPAGAITFR